uniref:Toprim domain-containing protein n=1 Tax=Acidithiobacillus ferrianus TaxID=2678518 RepID=A0A845UDQ3_9PROT|nr:hypothetical protein [Acidithiobacillus ferrianus]NDU43475.1 hypothetical protein [Acidithiobacillus ferrianus]
MNTTLAFTTNQVIQAMQSRGIPFQIEGRQVNADLAGSGHHHIKITPHKGLYLDSSTGKGGTIAALLRQIGAQAPAPAPAGAQAPAHPANGGHSSGSTIHAAQRVWNASWTCTHGQDMPAGWDKGLNSSQKGTRRVALERQRDAVRSYLTARLGPDHLDHWTRQVRISGDGLMLNPMQNGGVITGIQRTYFDQDGQKSERKMLGPQGTTFCPVPTGVNPRDLGVGSVKLAGEGWETIASTVQAAGWPGLACQFDGGVVKWATEQSSQAKNMTAEQLAAAPAVVVLVDRDGSGAGQKASAKAVKILRAVGLRAYYAIPPAPEHGGPKGGHKGSDWGDYSKEGLSSEVLAAHLALAIAHSDQEMPEIDEPGMVLPSSVQIRAWRPSENPQPPAQSSPTHEVRAGLQTALQQTVADYLAWMKDKDTPFHPVLMMPTTGTGKSSAAKALTRNTGLRLESGRVCVFVPDHDQAGEYAAEGFFHFFGRTPDPDSPAYCPNHATAQEAMDKGHISQAEVCLQCSNGFAWQIDYYSDGDGQTTKAAPEKVAKAKSLLAARGLDWKTVTPCVWQSHLRDALEAQFTVAAAGSYSHSLTRDSLCIFDEHFEPGKGVNVTLQDIDHWIRRTQSIIEHLEKGDDADALGRHRQAGEFFRAMALAMAGWVGKTCAINIDTVLLESIKGILEAARQSSKSDIALAGWEKLQFNAAGEMSDNPLRAAHAIAESLKFGDGYVHDGQLVVAHSLPVMERLAGGQPTVIMDATPDPVIADVVQAQGGQIINAIAHQNVKISRHPTRFWGLTPLNVKRSGAERRDREIQKYESLMNHHDHDGAAFLFHKKAADAIDPEDENPMLGHWGRHHRAHNSWSGKPLVIVGSFFPPMEAWRAEYQRSRIAALSAGANPENWPVWPDDLQMIPDMWICEGDTDVQCRLPLPADDHIREWLLNRVTSETVQACGRARGANSETAIDIHIYGGVPLHGLWQHGLDIASYEADPECLGQTKAEHMEDMQEERETSLAKVDVLAARVISKGQTVTRAALESEAVTMAATGTDGPQSPVEYGLCQGGYNIHTTPAQRESAHTQAFTMPHERVVQEWFQTRAPLISQHLSTTGRNARTIKAAQEAALRFGEEMVKEALQMADLLFKSTGGDADRLAGIAWDTIEYGDASDAELVAARLVLVALGETEGVPPPW